MQPILMDVEKARKGKDFDHDEAYSPGQFKKVAQMLLDASPYHAVAWAVLAREVGGERPCLVELARVKASCETLANPHCITHNFLF